MDEGKFDALNKDKFVNSRRNIHSTIVKRKKYICAFIF